MENEVVLDVIIIVYFIFIIFVKEVGEGGYVLYYINSFFIWLIVLEGVKI